MPKSEMYRRGLEMRQKMMGDAMVDAMEKSVYNDPIMDKFRDYSTEAVFGLLWSRPGLDTKTRALICVVMDAAMHTWPELVLHLKMARRQGWTEDELTETLLHMSGYIGVPSIRESMIIAKDVFAELREEA